MSHWLDETRVRQDVVIIPRLWVTIAASALVHLAILFIWIPRTELLTPGEQLRDPLRERLQVRLQAPAEEPVSAPAAPPASPSRTRPPRTMARLRPPPLISPPPEAPGAAAPVPGPPAVAAVPAPPAIAAAPRRPVEGDLAAYVEAKRRERGEQALSDNESAQFNQTIAANLPAPARGVAAQDTKRGGGIFQIKRMTYDDAAFEFYGWNTD